MNLMLAVEDRMADPLAVRVFEVLIIAACSGELTRKRWERLLDLAKDTTKIWVQKQRGTGALKQGGVNLPGLGLYAPSWFGIPTNPGADPQSITLIANAKKKKAARTQAPPAKTSP
jgi:hypothetical protein